MNENLNELNELNEIELQKLRQEVLEWIEKNEGKKATGGRFDILKNKGRPSLLRKVGYKTRSFYFSGQLNLWKEKIESFFQKKERSQATVRDKKLSGLSVPLMITDVNFKTRNIPALKKQVVSKKKILERKKEKRDEFFIQFYQIFYKIGGIFHSVFLRFFVAGAIFVVLFLFYIFFKIYVIGSTDAFVSFGTKILPFPAVSVEKRWIPYTHYEKDSEAIKKITLFSFDIFRPYKKDLSVFNNTLRFYALHDLFQKNNIRLTKANISDAYALLVWSSNGKEKLDSTLRYLNVEQDELRRYASIPLAGILKLHDLYKTRDERWLEEKKNIDTLMEDIRLRKISISDAAREYSQDISALNNGDMGFFKNSDIIPILGDRVFRMNSGAISEVLETLDGFYIFEVTDIVDALNMRKANLIYREHYFDVYKKIEEEMRKVKVKKFIAQ